MKKALKDRYIWLIVAFFLGFVTYNYLQVNELVSWFPTLAATPFSDTAIDLGFYFSIIALSSSRFNTRGGIVAAIAGFPILVYCHKNGLSNIDVWVEISFSAFSGVIIAAIVGRYVTAQKQLQAAHDELRAEHTKTQDANEKLQKALAEVKTISGLIPICASCKKIRNDKGFYESVEHYIKEHSTADFTHGICEECVAKLYPDLDLKSAS
jgi:hypothetical protein